MSKVTLAEYVPMVGPKPAHDPVLFTDLLDARRAMVNAAMEVGKCWTLEHSVWQARNATYTTALSTFDNLLIEASYRGIKV